jgi:hypothetical protein
MRLQLSLTLIIEVMEGAAGKGGGVHFQCFHTLNQESGHPLVAGIAGTPEFHCLHFAPLPFANGTVDPPVTISGGGGRNG